MSKIVVMGGSFYPPTISHQRLLLGAVNALGADKGIFVPSSHTYVSIKMRRAKLPEEVLREEEKQPFTLEAAFELHQRRKENEKPVLILNFANPHRPGGGIRSKPGTQEEHLCVKTTVLCSLETEEAWPFYQTNLDCGTQAQTDTILFSPHTMVIRNPDLSLREDPFPVAVMTVSAPIASRMEPEELPGLESTLRNRIRGMLRAAAGEGYIRLVLGAWGCGNFGNDPELVAKLFHEALQGCFMEVTMAVFDNSDDQYRYSCFEKYFGNMDAGVESDRW